MPLHLEAIDSSVTAKPIPVQAGRPRVFKIVKRGHDAGTVTVEMHDGQCFVTNRSERPVLVNGTELTRSILVHGDTVIIGKDSFRVVEDQPVVDDIEPIDLHRASGYHPTPSLPAGHGAAAPPAALAPRASDGDDKASSADSDRQRRRRSISASMNVRQRSAEADHPQSRLVGVQRPDAQ